jgi:hypothetical protein
VATAAPMIRQYLISAHFIGHHEATHDLILDAHCSGLKSEWLEHAG